METVPPERSDDASIKAHHAPRDTYNTMQRVDDNVYIGGYAIAGDAAVLAKHGITNIVKLFSDKVKFPESKPRVPGVTYAVFAVADDPRQPIAQTAFAATDFIDKAVARGEKVLVHCHAGVSRSATVVLLHIMLNHGYTLDEALARLRRVRPQVDPNEGFMRFLRKIDRLLASVADPTAAGPRVRPVRDTTESTAAAAVAPKGAGPRGTGVRPLHAGAFESKPSEIVTRGTPPPVAATSSRPLRANLDSAGGSDEALEYPVIPEGPVPWKFEG